MANTRGRAGRRALPAAGRGRPRLRKSGSSKISRSKSRSPKPTNSAATRPKPAAASGSARLKQQLKAVRLQLQASANETREALERQAATADILKVIASSPSDLRPVFDSIVANAKRLVGGLTAGAYRFADGLAHLITATPLNPAADEALRAAFPRPIAEIEHFRLAAAGELLQIADTEDQRDVTLKEVARSRGYRSILFVPLRSHGETIGTLAVTRSDPGPFSNHHVRLLQTFADQAVIAIENARLFNETREALERQTATADVLKVIASSPSKLEPVFEAIATRSNRLLDGHSTAVWRLLDDFAHLVAFTSTDPTGDRALRALSPLRIGQNPALDVIRQGEVVHIPDTERIPLSMSEDGADAMRDVARARGYRSQLMAPLVIEQKAVGWISITRREPGGFAPEDVQLLRTFADQAVIAIENVRLFNETQEALAYQTGSSNVLRVIASSPTDVEPVLNAIVESARELCEAIDAVVLLRDGEHLCFSAHSGPLPVTVDKWPIGRGWTAGRAFVDQKPVHVHDMLSEEGADFPDARVMGQSTGATIHTVLSVPLLRVNESIGAILLRRAEVRPFDDKQINLLSTFADQAVIAIENARLFNETREALERQTATAEVLQVINSSPGDLAPVFEAMLDRAIRLCNAVSGHFRTYDGNGFSLAAVRGEAKHIEAMRQSGPLVPGPHHPVSRFLRGDNLIHLPNTKESEEYRADARFRSLVDLGVLSLLSVALRKDTVLLGYINVYRHAAEPFTDRQIALLQNFASQAVIAMENARLLSELRARTDDLTEALVYQTGSSNILKVIASSPTDVGPALQAIVDSACEICDAPDAAVFLKDGHDLVFSAHHGSMPNPIGRWPINRNWVTGRAVMDKVPQQARDLLGESGDEFPEARNVVPGQVHRTVLSIPLLREGDAIGAISLRRMEAQPFSEKQIELLWSFADQAVISISNARLFEQVQDRTRELSKSLDDLRTAQDRLIQTEKLASLGQLTAGIAHEIKNPLNFVNNFSALSVELTDELNEVLAQAELATKLRQEVGELTALLKDNLSKVVQHGKRADSIVKNMLLHSREGSGERRSAEINALVAESLNLAYHGARAEKTGFSITLKQDFDPEVGAADLYPQEITRALLNLISNGFYAATRRKVEAGDETFEPVLSAATRNLGKTVEIRIRDNGTGVSPEVRAKMFNPFFTTKPTGEGTGLGLSMTHDIIVKQHGGRIDVETELGVFTEFIVTLPRDGSAARK